MKIPKLHRITAIGFTPFFLLISITGIMLLGRKTGLYSEKIKTIVFNIHNWEIFVPYVGLIPALALILVATTGVILYFNRRA